MNIIYISLGILFIIGLILLFWARFISTSGLVIKKYEIKTNIDFNNLKIVHFTDVHYGSTINLKKLKNIIKSINDQHPDFVVFTGDLVEKRVKLNKQEIKDLTKELNKLNPKYKVLAVPGNHDYDHEYFHDITPNLKWHILKNKNERFSLENKKSSIVFIGLDDLLYGNPNYKNAFNLKTDNDFQIVLAHEPDQVDEFIDYNFDLVLCGHSHLGQVRFPILGAVYTPKGSKKYYDEHYKIKNANLYINGGIGTSGLKLRFLNKPSISIYNFKNK